MSVTIDWMDSQYRIIHANFIDHWDWSELEQALSNAHCLMTKSSCKVSLIFDFLGSIKASSNQQLVTEKILPAPSKLLRFIIIIDDPILARHLMQHLQDLYPNADEIRSVSSHIAAFSLIRQTLETAHSK